MAPVLGSRALDGKSKVCCSWDSINKIMVKGNLSGHMLDQASCQDQLVLNHYGSMCFGLFMLIQQQRSVYVISYTDAFVVIAHGFSFSAIDGLEIFFMAFLG